jgi:ubiquinone/menaquinone biosynthesis C-methylase UbiE
MERILEPELMLDEAQALAYAQGDFVEPHNQIVAEFRQRFPELPARGTLLDLGCGPGDITLRLARRLPGWRIDGVDGSPAMLALGRKAVAVEAGMGDRIRLIEGLIPDTPLPRTRYDAVFSNSLLHHLPDPAVLWATIRRYAAPGAAVYVADLFRPASREAAAELRERYSGKEPEVLQRDFFNSLCAAFTPAEVRGQLVSADLPALRVETISDRHLVVWGRVWPRTEQGNAGDQPARLA